MNTGLVEWAIRPVADVRPRPEWLTAPELARHRRLVRVADRAAYLAAHTLVRECAAALVGTPPGEVGFGQRCASCGDVDHGAPYVEGGVRVSLSHTRGHVAAIAAPTPCGIDVELVRAGAPPAGVLTPRETSWVERQPDPARAFTGLWVRKEALIKAGVGHLGEVGALEVLEPGAGVGDVHDWVGAAAMGAWVVRPIEA
ncbi:MAG: 4'-phosphopantetheinyl transferase superfamily protein [Nocardioides sp.]|uniref:4'-phosphopantetheinyl transferase family protein n=1 Tax=Nocardioides sp. TaxID=35761 RepID=UPI0039E31B1E